MPGEQEEVPRYPRYKDSGVEWIGEVPEHWSIERLARCVQSCEKRVEPEEITPETKFIAPENMERDTGRLMNHQILDTDTIEGPKLSFALGQVLYSKIRPYLNKATVAPFSGLTTTDMYVLSTVSGATDPRFVLYFLLSDYFSSVASASSTGMGMPRIGRNAMSETALALPALAEQRSISLHLDEKTTEIDELIKEQEETIALLKEKRSSLISETVTKGLDRSVKMKDSGVEWIGEVPEHWECARIGGLTRRRTETVSDSVFQPLSVTKLGIVPQLATAAKSDDGDNRSLVRQGDFVINSRSDRKGSAGISPLDGSVTKISIVAILNSALLGDYCDRLLKSIPFQEEFYRYGSGIVSDLWTTSYERMKQISIPLPPSSEQAHIAKYLDEKTAEIDELIKEQEEMIELLKERRSSLISEVVTGKRRVVDLDQLP